ncbi:hypothetical protein ACP70R_006213 [Stipagrostis hirtigluma subsp. patula]
MASSSSQQGVELILAASHGRPITAYDALTGKVVAEFPAANTPRHGLAVITGPATAALVAASHVCPDTGAGSIRLLRCWSAAHARSLPVPEPVAALVAAPHGSHLLAGGASGRVHAVALPSGEVTFSFRAHGGGGGGVSCLALSEDGSLLVSGGDDGVVAVFPLISVLDVDAAKRAPADLAVYRIAAHVGRVTGLACAQRGCNSVVASASSDRTCKVWNLADGRRLRTFALPCAALSLALDAGSSTLYAGGSDGRVYVAPLSSPATNTVMHSPHAGGSTDANFAAAIVGVGVANGGKNLVSCSEDGEVKVWDPTRGGLLLVNTFRTRVPVSGVLVATWPAGEAARGGGDDGEGSRANDAAAWTRTRELLEMEEMLRGSVGDRTRSVELIEMNANIYRRCLRLLLQEITFVANGGRRNGGRDGNVSD